MARPVIPPDGIDPGLYFDMSEEVYHADHALGSTDLRRLLQGPSEFHYGWSGNPDPDDGEDTGALTFGRAVHKLVLEGQQAFDAEYAMKPEGPDVLVTKEDLVAWCRANSILDKGTKETLGERILNINPHVIIQDREVEKLKAAGKTILAADDYKRILIASAYITKSPDLAKSFEGGRREVSIFWIRNGVRMKARIDHLKVIQWQERRTALLTDLKSFGKPKPNETLRAATKLAAAGYKHQPAHYFDGLYHARKHIQAGLVHGETDADWLQRVATTQAMLWAFVFFKRIGAPYASSILLSPQNPIVENARRDIENAIDLFRRCYETYGPEGPWLSLDGPEELSQDELPRWAL